MKPEKQRIAIAEACGRDADYLGDLNAMHEAERFLTPSERMKYIAELFNLPTAECESNVFATAEQKAKAFLKTIEKWEDET
jgi:hypothetical protein